MTSNVAVSVVFIVSAIVSILLLFMVSVQFGPVANELPRVTFPPVIAVVPSGVVAPTAPAKNTVPVPAVTVHMSLPLVVPLSVPLNETAPFAELVFTVIPEVLLSTAFVFTAKEAREAVEPMLCLNVAVPKPTVPEETVSDCVPAIAASIVLSNSIATAPEVALLFIVRLFCNTTFPLNVSEPAVVWVTLLYKLIVPLPSFATNVTGVDLTETVLKYV